MQGGAGGVGSSLFNDDSDSDDGRMFGFSSSDVEELLCQGIKPWDDDAPMALAVLRGDDDFYWSRVMDVLPLARMFCFQAVSTHKDINFIA